MAVRVALAIVVMLAFIAGWLATSGDPADRIDNSADEHADGHSIGGPDGIIIDHEGDR